MSSNSNPDQTAKGATTSRVKSFPRRVLWMLLALAIVYFAIAYLVLPLAWNRYETRHPWLDEIPGITEAGDGIPGDPLNVALIGDESKVKALLSSANWSAADPLGVKSDLRIAADTVLRRSYEDAPVSSLYLFGRKEDLAYEKPFGDDPRRRHHVRFWRGKQLDEQGRPVWFGAATFDQRVGLSHTTGEITHHIAPDIDTERDFLIRSLQDTGLLVEQYYVDSFHKVTTGRNGGGDPWHTDGRLSVGVISPD